MLVNLLLQDGEFSTMREFANVLGRTNYMEGVMRK